MSKEEEGKRKTGTSNLGLYRGSGDRWEKCPDHDTINLPEGTKKGDSPSWNALARGLQKDKDRGKELDMNYTWKGRGRGNRPISLSTLDGGEIEKQTTGPHGFPYNNTKKGKGFTLFSEGGAHSPLFQPKRGSPSSVTYLAYLQKRMKGGAN